MSLEAHKCRDGEFISLQEFLNAPLGLVKFSLSPELCDKLFFDCENRGNSLSANKNRSDSGLIDNFGGRVNKTKIWT